MQRNICLAFSYKEISLKLWNLTKQTITANGMMLQKLNLDSIHSYQVFQKHEKAQYDKQKKVINAHPGYQKIRVHLIFAVKYDGRHQARLNRILSMSEILLVL